MPEHVAQEGWGRLILPGSGQAPGPRVAWPLRPGARQATSSADKPTATREAQPAVLPSRVASGSCTCAETPVTGCPCHGVLLPGIGTVCVRVTRGLLMCCLPLRKECGLPMETRAVLGWEAGVLQGPHVLREVMHHMEPET